MEARSLQADVMQLLEERNAALSAALDTQRALMQLLRR
jgi:hypothetical protein